MIDAQALICESMELIDGILHWRTRPEHHFASPVDQRRWNTKLAGKQVGRRTNSQGYHRVRLRPHDFAAHRVIWLLTFGEWPNGEIDHINGNRSDNRTENLRVVSRSENARNMALRSDNKSGISGVHWHSSHKRWIVTLTVDQDRRQIGSFKSKEAAIHARLAAQSQSGFTGRHGTRA